MDLCPTCGKIVTPDKRGRKRKYCSPSCSREQLKIVNIGRISPFKKCIDKNCPVCGKVFVSRRRDSGNKTQQFCSSKCYGRALETSPKEFTCLGCGTNSSRRHGTVQKYCSWGCWSKYHIPWNTKPAKTLPGDPCPICSKPIKKRNNKTCSLVCARKLSSIWHKQSGVLPPSQMGKKWGVDYPIENHPWWRGGITPLRTQIYHLDKAKTWRKTILTRDNFTCQFCGNRGGKLCVDHIKPFALILHENKIDTTEKATLCKELWDLKNGRVLCKDCHLSTDTYGINTKWIIKRITP